MLCLFKTWIWFILSPLLSCKAFWRLEFVPSIFLVISNHYSIKFFGLFLRLCNYIISPFPFLKTPLYFLLVLLIHGFFFINYYYMKICICIPKYNLVSLYSIACIYVFMTDRLVLDNQLVCFSLGKTYFSHSLHSLFTCGSLYRAEASSSSLSILECLLVFLNSWYLDICVGETL